MKIVPDPQGHDTETYANLQRILVVDDIPEICELFRALHRRLRGMHTELTVEVNSARALELVRRQAFDVIVSDFRMREVDGVEILRTAAATNPGGRRVLMTGYNEIPTSMARIASAQVDAYVQKPLQYQEVLLLLIAMLKAEPDGLAGYRAKAREMEALGAAEEDVRAGRHSASMA